MPLTDPDRLYRQIASPRIVLLWRALQPLQSVVSFMNTGAHPDDETSKMLAALAFRDGLALSYVCANRGEGGQNDIGPEVTHDLGVIRTAEMERAADRLDMRLYWLSESPDDTIFDFGFSKSGSETLGKWGHERVLERLVRVIRSERPDIVCPTFLDIPGQHGHHRAMTQAAREAVDAAADPTFSGVELAPWQIKKLYLPAWSGAGASYDDDLPPPPATITVDADGEDPVSGWSWAQIGEHSRVLHRTQGMGRWAPHGQPNRWPLHLVRSVCDAPDTTLTSGLPETLGELASLADARVIAGILERAQGACEAARAAFPDMAAVRAHAATALSRVRQARKACPKGAVHEVAHRLDRKEEQISQVIALAAGAQATARLGADFLRPGDRMPISLIAAGTDSKAELVLPEGWIVDDGCLVVPDGADPTNSYPDTYRPERAELPVIRLSTQTDGVPSRVLQPLEVSPIVLPARSVVIDGESHLVNLKTPASSLSVRLSEVFPAGSTPSLALPDGWSARNEDDGFAVDPPAGVSAGIYEIPLLLHGELIHCVRRFAYPHIPPRARTEPAKIVVRVLEAVLPEAAIGYVGGGNDRVEHWLGALGLPVVSVSDDMLSDAGLDRYDTLVVGIFAIRTRLAFRAALPAVHEWVKRGGNLVTLYHRPWDAWDPDSVPPAHLEIGKPSLRWRVTDENAAVTHIASDHPLLTSPNAIGEADWRDWHKERGLYLAKSWADAYTPLLSMADPDEEAHLGALLSARIGKGRHTHTSLILHHQMEKLVPGAFRLMANLVAPA